MEIIKKLKGAFPESAVEKRDRLPAGREITPYRIEKTDRVCINTGC
jgi:hypothetical protein